MLQARRATIAIGRELERRLPGKVTTRWWKEARGEAIFVDSSASGSYTT